MKRITIVGLAMFAASAACAAGVPTIPVPEIDAVAGLAAFGLVGTAVALIWERRRQ